MRIMDRREWTALAIRDCGTACGEMADGMRLPEDARRAELARMKNALGLIDRAREWVHRSIQDLEG